MSSDYKINSSLFGSLNEIIGNPFIVMDNVGNILSFNKEAGLLLNLQQPKSNIYDQLDDTSSEFLSGMIEKLFSSSGPLVQITNLKLRHGSEIRGEIQLNSYKEENEYFIFLSLKTDEIITSSAISDISVINGELKDIFSNREIIKEIEEVRNNFPFSLIGKESFRKKIDQLEEIFWIEDTLGKYVVVNNLLSKYIGVKVKQMEGKKVNNFLLPIMGSLFESINKFISESGNSVIIKGIPFKGEERNNLYETIKIPLFNRGHDLIAFIGITQKIIQKVDIPLLSIESLPDSAAFVDQKGEIKQINKRLLALLSREPGFVLNVNFEKVFPKELVIQIRNFLSEHENELKLTFSGKMHEDKRINDTFSVYLSKIFNNINHYDGFLIVLQEVSSKDDFENLISKRGRMFDILIQNNPEPIFIYDTENLRFLEANQAALNLYGYRKEEFLQMDLTDLYTPEDIQTLLDSSNSADKFGKFTGPYRHKRKNGTSVFVEISKILFKFQEKDAHFNIIKDVTEKLESDKKTQLYKSVFDNSQDLLFVTDSTGFITYINKAVSETLKISKTDFENRSFATLVKDEDRGTVATSIFQSHLIDPVSLNMELKKDDGLFIDTELTATPIINYKNEVESFIIIGHIKEQVVIKEVVKEVEKERSDSVLPNTLPANKEIDESFLSNMFHEILTPINVIIGFIGELSDSSQNLTPEQKEALDIINQNRTTLLNTMNSIMEFSSIKQEKFDLKPQDISITEIIDYLQKDIEDLSTGRGVDFAYGKISSSLRFETDKKKFQHLISLLLNIITQLTKNKKIYFSAYQLDQEKFVISIKDNYSSVSKPLLDNLKSLFEGKINKIGKDHGTSKLTLKLVKQLFVLLNGQFEIMNLGDKNDYGFVFPLKFSFIPTVEENISAPEKVIEQEPLAYSIPENKPEPLKNPDIDRNKITKEEALEPPKWKTKSKIVTEEGFEEVPSSKIILKKYDYNEPEIEEPVKFEEELRELEKEIKEVKPDNKSTQIDLSKMSCLYIEDQIDSQILFKVQMKELKEIKYAVSFEEALPLLDNGQFDFIVMDINLQGEYNGLDALKIIHKMPAYQKIPIIAVTAYVLPGDKEKFIVTGFNDFISKPIFREKMIDSLERIFLLQM
jgi:PAS domain S-box-containing protein